MTALRSAAQPASTSGNTVAQPLLESLLGHHLDPGYQAAADAKARDALLTAQAPADQVAAGAGPRRRAAAGARRVAIGYLVAGALAVGLVLGIAGASTRDQSVGTGQARTGLLADIDSAQSSQAALTQQRAHLAGDVRSAQAALGASGPLQSVRKLELQAAQTPVTGPGLTVTIDGSTTSSGAGVLLDSDLQLLINGLWSAGAEAVSVGGVRLRATSTIRQAGSAILVDNRPVFWPIDIEAVGDPVTLHVRFVSTAGFGRFSTFVSLYGVRFVVTDGPALTLPAAAAPDLHYASAEPAPSTQRAARGRP